MKKLIILCLGFLLFGAIIPMQYAAGMTPLDDDTPLQKLPYGKYTCQTGRDNDCEFAHSKKSFFSLFCPRNLEKVQLIKEGKCKFEALETAAYLCKYDKGTCTVKLSPNGNSINCSGNIPDGKNKAYNDTINGKCNLK